MLGFDGEPGGRPPAPQELQLLQRFINTYNHLFPDRDELEARDQARRWLVHYGLLGRRDSFDDVAHRSVIRFREALRRLVSTNAGEALDERSSSILQRLGRSPMLSVIIDLSGGISLESTGQGIDRVVGTLLATTVAATETGNWERLKTCKRCQWVFFDRSRNRSARWCAMTVCGNRSKNRDYRRRREVAGRTTTELA